MRIHCSKSATCANCFTTVSESGVWLGLDAGLSHSCYDPAPDGAACGECDACRMRAKGFEEAGLPDPTRYVAA